MIAELKARVAEIKDSALRSACNALWMDIRYDAFFTRPASLSFHHSYSGGLAVHTLEVATYALNIAGMFPQVNRDVLLAAALWHDVAKIHEYRVGMPSAIWEKTDYVRTIGHIAGSAGEFLAASRYHLDRATEEAVVHCILAHHGPVREWGSPVAPESLEALILHQADMLSAKYGVTK